MIPKAKINMGIHEKKKVFSIAKQTVGKMKRQPMDWEKSDLSNKKFMYKIPEEFL